MSKPRILITRTRHQASGLVIAVERMGAEAIVVPMIQVVPPASFAELDSAIHLLDGNNETVDCVIFTSANAAQALADRAAALGAKLYFRQIAAIGPATAKAIREAVLAPTLGPILLPKEYVAEALAAALLHANERPRSFLLIRAEEARDVLPFMLKAAGHGVCVASAYRNLTPEGTLAMLRDLFSSKDRYPDMITFTSSSTARNLVSLLDSIGKKIPIGIALASIGPITSATLQELGYKPTFEAAEPTIESLVAAIATHLGPGLGLG